MYPYLFVESVYLRFYNYLLSLCYFFIDSKSCDSWNSVRQGVCKGFNTKEAMMGWTRRPRPKWMGWTRRPSHHLVLQSFSYRNSHYQWKDNIKIKDSDKTADKHFKQINKDTKINISEYQCDVSCHIVNLERFYIIAFRCV